MAYGACSRYTARRLSPAPRTNSLPPLLGVRPGEGRRTALAGLYHLLFVAAVVMVKSASNALVVARFNAEALPPLYIASAVVTGLVAWGAAHLIRGQGRRLPKRGLGFGAALLLALAAALEFGAPAAVILTYLFGEAFATLISIRFWGAAAEHFDLRARRRIFGLLGASGMVGAILAGLATQLLGPTIGAVGLLPLAAGLLACGVAVSIALGRPLRDREQAATETGRRAPAKDVRTYLLRNHYPRAVATLMLLLAALTALADFVFRKAAGATYSEAELAGLFGALNLWMGVVAVVFQALAAGRILERFGVFRYLLLTPLGTAGAAAACLVAPGLWPAFALRLIESSGSLSLNPAAFQLLYAPIPDSLRPQIRSLIDGLVKKLGFAAGGALLLVLGSRAGLPLLVGAIIGVVAVFVVVLTLSRRFYVKAIEDRLAPAPSRGADFGSAEARSALRQALRSPEPVRVLTSLSILRGDRRFEPMPHLPRLITHEDHRVRLAAVELISDRRITHGAPHLERLLAGDVQEVQSEAALALAKLAPPRAAELLLPWLEKRDSPLSAAAIAALLPIEQTAAQAKEALLARLDDADAPARERLETASALGRMGPTAYGHRLAQYLDDPDPTVRRAACLAVGQAREQGLIRKLAALLADHEVRVAARSALVEFGDEVVPALSQLLDDRQKPLGLRLEVPKVLRKIGTDAAARALLFSNIQEHPYLRYQIATNLSRLHEEHPEVKVDLRRLREATFRRLRYYEYTLPIYRDLEAALPSRAALLRAMSDRMQQNLEVTFRLLQLRHPEGQLVAAWRRFARGNAAERSYALELLEHLLDEEVRRVILPILERWHQLPEPWGGVPGNEARAPARVMELSVSDDEILRALAIDAARRHWPADPPLPPGIEEESSMDAKVIERVFQLEGAEIFARCDIDDLVALATIGRESAATKGEVIFKEGTPADALFVILEGEVRFEKGGSEVLSVGVGDAFGETSLLDYQPRPVTAIAAAQEVRLLKIDRHDFLDLIADRPEILRGIFEAVTRHMRSLIDVAAGGEPEVAEGELLPRRTA